MTITLFLSAAILLLWIIPAVYAFQTRSPRVLVEAGVLMVLSVSLPFIIAITERELYGLAGKVNLSDALFIASLQLILWLGGMILPLLARKRVAPAPMAPRVVAPVSRPAVTGEQRRQ